MQNSKRTFLILSNKFKPCVNRIVLTLQFHKLKTECHESVQEWMDKWQTKEAKCGLKEYDRELMEQFIHGLDNEGIIHEILSWKPLIMLQAKGSYYGPTEYKHRRRHWPA